MRGLIALKHPPLPGREHDPNIGVGQVRKALEPRTAATGVMVPS